MRPLRNYKEMIARHRLQVPALPPPPATSAEIFRHQVMRRAIDILWGAMGSTGYSWIGFYELAPDQKEMVLLCREPKPACSPIGLHGMCGKSLKERRPIIVGNVESLGSNYIACDPKDKSELVIPLIDANGGCRAVIDLDSYDVESFDASDVNGVTSLLIALGLTPPSALALEPLRL